MGGLTGPDAELREVQDKILDIMGPLGTADAKKAGHQLFRPNPPRGRPYLARGGSWNNVRRGIRPGRWQTRSRPTSQG